MKEMTVNEAMNLVRSEPAPAISLYVGTNITDHDGPSKIAANMQRLYKTAEALVNRTYDSRTRDRLLQPLKKALATLRLHRSKGGVAIYHSEKFTGLVRLPTKVSDIAVAAKSFHLKPVLKCLQVRKNYYILALRKKSLDLILVTPHETKVVERIPMDFKEQKGGISEDSRKHWLKDNLKIRRQKDFREAMLGASRQLAPYLHGERLPLILAGPHHKVEAFRDTCHSLQIVEQDLIGSVESLDLKSLATLSEPIMEQYFSKFDDFVLAHYHKSLSYGLASSNLRQIAAASVRGQIHHLLIADDRQLWGKFDRETGAVHVVESRVDASTDDLLDDIAEMTILKGGKVTILPSYQMPSRQPIAAVFRWSHSETPLHEYSLITPSRPRPLESVPVQMHG